MSWHNITQVVTPAQSIRVYMRTKQRCHDNHDCMTHETLLGRLTGRSEDIKTHELASSGRPTLVGKALSFTDKLSFIFFLSLVFIHRA